jgi:hypothetical protein
MRKSIRYRKGYKYQLAEDAEIYVDIYPVHDIETDWIALSFAGRLTARTGYAWDGPSGPTIDTPDSMRGSLFHDALYQLMRLGLLDQKYRPIADKLLHDICIEDGMNHLRAALWKMAVEDFAAGAAKAGTEREILTAPREAA